MSLTAASEGRKKKGFSDRLKTRDICQKLTISPKKWLPFTPFSPRGVAICFVDLPLMSEPSLL